MKQALINNLHRWTAIESVVLDHRLCAKSLAIFIPWFGIARSLCDDYRRAEVPIWFGAFPVIVVSTFVLGGLFLDLISILILTVSGHVCRLIPSTLVLIRSGSGICCHSLLDRDPHRTPPVGMNVFVVSSVSGIPLQEGFAVRAGNHCCRSWSLVFLLVVFRKSHFGCPKQQ